MDIETRLTNLENLVFSFIRSQQRKDTYTDYDVEGTRHSIADTNVSVEQNTSDISDNRDGIVETYENGEVNSSDITDLRSAVEEIYEMISESEG